MEKKKTKKIKKKEITRKRKLIGPKKGNYQKKKTKKIEKMKL